MTKLLAFALMAAIWQQQHDELKPASVQRLLDHSPWMGNEYVKDLDMVVKMVQATYLPDDPEIDYKLSGCPVLQFCSEKQKQ